MQFGGVIDGEHDYGVGSLKKVILGLKRRDTRGKSSDFVVVLFVWWIVMIFCDVVDFVLWRDRGTFLREGATDDGEDEKTETFEEELNQPHLQTDEP